MSLSVVTYPYMELDIANYDYKTQTQRVHLISPKRETLMKLKHCPLPLINNHLLSGIHLKYFSISYHVPLNSHAIILSSVNKMKKKYECIILSN